MKILMVSDVYFPRVNGVSTSIATFRKELDKLGHEVWLIAPAYGEDSEDEARILRVKSSRILLDPEDRMMKTGGVLDLYGRLKREGFELVHIQTPFIAHYAGVRLARRLGIPVVESYHTYFEQYLFHYVPFLPKTLMKMLARIFSRRQCNQVDAVVVPSRAMQQVLAGYGVSTHMEIIPTGIDPGIMQCGSKQRFCGVHGIDSTRPVLMYVGRVAHEKNIAFLLRVLDQVRRQVPGVLLVIAGEGPARAGLERLAGDLALEANLRFVNYLPRGPALWDCFCAGDVFVFASSTETQGLVLLEAMALGIPLVSTSVMGTQDIVGPGRGALVAPESVSEFAGQVVRLLQDPGLRARLSTEARDCAAEWSALRMAERMAALYTGLVSGKACESPKSGDLAA